MITSAHGMDCRKKNVNDDTYDDYYDYANNDYDNNNDHDNNYSDAAAVGVPHFSYYNLHFLFGDYILNLGKCYFCNDIS